MTLLYNLVMLAVDLAAIWLLCRRRGLVTWVGTMAGAGVAAAFLGGVLGEDAFGIVRLWCYGLFLHGTVLLAASAVLWRRERRLLAVCAALAAMTLVLTAADAFLVEPHWLEVSHWRIASPKIHRPLRIVVLADLQCDQLGQYERTVVRQALAEKPDILLLAGDYIEVPWARRATLRRELHDFLQEAGLGLHARVFAVQGNVDSSDWADIFEGLNVTTVADRRSFDLGELQLTCLGLTQSCDPSLVVADPAPGRFHLVLGHVPNFALGAIHADLLVAGHTHGGQVRLPWLGALMTLSRIPRGWAAGLTALPGGGQLLVSRGIGMERFHAPPIRFLCRPELIVIELVPES